MDPVFTFQFPKQFRSELLLEALEYAQQDTFTSDIKPIMAPVVAALVRHNAMVMVSFEWLRVFRVAQFADPAYTFVYGFIDAHYEMICLICGQNEVNLENLDVSNSISENLLCHILTCLESQTPQIYTTDQQLDIIKHTDFWRMIFNAKNNVTILHKHSHVMKIRTTISNFASAIVDKTIDIKTLQAILSKSSDEHLYKCLNVVNNSNTKKTFQSVIVTESNISAVRKECNAYEERLRHLKAFYSTFCPPSKVVDSYLYTRDLEGKLKMLSNISLNDTSSSHYWGRHDDIIQMAEDIYEFSNSKTFIDIYETHLSQITDEINVDYVVNTLMPAVCEEHRKTFKKI
ncbi:hypothetical protein C2G38_2310605 [Gigaspora rosea]|uniref:Uncharacterized protein n=1 Tax=Gigaspora rosea TaxID=44941 RepID=A0A397V713_9GLOM|nr:hypothetical protein C2G38_2310605 [Gigaspora rosea]